VAVGGGTASRVWPQIVADVTDRELVVPAVTVGAAYGDAFLAGVATDRTDPGACWARTRTVIIPDPAAANHYARLYALYRRAYGDTAAISHSLASIQEAGAAVRS
jgi:xylulokinase